MEQVHFRGQIRVICKRAKRVDGGMDDDAGEQAAAAIKERDQQEADRNRKNDLAQIIDQIHAAAVEQVDDMPDAESHTGNYNGRFDIVLCNGLQTGAPGRSLPPKIQRRAYTRYGRPFPPVCN